MIYLYHNLKRDYIILHIYHLYIQGYSLYYMIHIIYFPTNPKYIFNKKEFIHKSYIKFDIDVQIFISCILLINYLSIDSKKYKHPNAKKHYYLILHHRNYYLKTFFNIYKYTPFLKKYLYILNNTSCINILYFFHNNIRNKR